MGGRQEDDQGKKDQAGLVTRREGKPSTEALLPL